MRQILVDYARSRARPSAMADAGSPWRSWRTCPITGDAELLALDDALEELSRIDERQGRIVEMKFFGGLSAPEISEVLGISLATVDRDWATARVWLHRQMSRGRIADDHAPGGSKSRNCCTRRCNSTASSARVSSMRPAVRRIAARRDRITALGRAEVSSSFLESPPSGSSGRGSDGIDLRTLGGRTDLCGAFQLMRKLGEGGMGQVWLAEQIAPVRRQVALKLIKAGMYDEAVVQRFQVRAPIAGDHGSSGHRQGVRCRGRRRRASRTS